MPDPASYTGLQAALIRTVQGFRKCEKAEFKHGIEVYADREDDSVWDAASDTTFSSQSDEDMYEASVDAFQSGDWVGPLTNMETWRFIDGKAECACGPIASLLPLPSLFQVSYPTGISNGG